MSSDTAARRRQWILFAAFTLAYFAWLGLNTLGSASADARLVLVFETDEFDHIVTLRRALDVNTMAHDWWIYGHFFFNLVLLPLLVWNAIQPVSDQAIIIALRLMSLVAAAGVVWWTFLLASRYWGYGAGWAAGVAVAILPAAFNYWAVTSHPDTLQMMCTIFTLYAACRYTEQGELRWMDWAAAGAGLAFSAKYGGVLLVPCLFLLALIVRPRTIDAPRASEHAWSPTRAALLVTGVVGVFVSLTLREPYTGARAVSAQDLQLAISVLLLLLGAALTSWQARRRLPRLPATIAIWVRIACFFWIAFAVTSPFALNRLTFVQGMMFDAKIVGFGQFFAAGGHPTDWFAVAASTQVIGPVLSVLAALSLAAFAVRVVRERSAALRSPEMVLWTWILVVLIVLMLRVVIRLDRYLLPIVPALIILAVAFVAGALARLSRRRLRVPQVAVCLAIAMWAGWEVKAGALQRQRALIHERQTRQDASETVAVGLRLPAHADPTAKVLYDYYSYVPPTYRAAKASWGMTLAEVEEFDPDVIVVTDKIRGRFRSIDDAQRFWNAAAFMEIYRFYQALEEGRLGFELVESAGPARIYRRIGLTK